MPTQVSAPASNILLTLIMLASSRQIRPATSVSLSKNYLSSPMSKVIALRSPSAITVAVASLSHLDVDSAGGPEGEVKSVEHGMDIFPPPARRKLEDHALHGV